MSRKMFATLLIAFVLLLNACAPTEQPPSTGAQTATALVGAAKEELMVQNAAASATAMLGGSPSVPVFTQTPMLPTPQGIAVVASATPTVAANGYTLASFCFNAEKLGVAFPTNRETAYAMFVRFSNGDTVTRPDDLSPLLTDGENKLYGWTYSRHGGSVEPLVTVTNPTLFMQNGWMHDKDLRALYGYTLAEAQVLDPGRDVTGAGIPGLTETVRVEGFTFFCEPPSAKAVAADKHLVNQRSNAFQIIQLP